jgi:NAD(P)-dependent dehydrogenase (short-subunit alcohol dehydrogenase family)
MKLINQTALITGGGTGIGKATAKLFASEGCQVLIAGRREQPLRETVMDIVNTGGKAAWLTADVSRENDVIRLVKATEARFGKIDILYNNAGIFFGINKTIVDLDEWEWDQTLSVNLKGAYLCSKHVIPIMVKNGGGRIINCSSISGHVGQRHQGAYNVAKGGLEMLTKCMALDFAQDHIRVNAVCPAWVEIEFNQADLAERSQEIAKLHPIGRVGQALDVAKAVLFLACDDSSWITGTSLMVDGGYTAQ